MASLNETLSDAIMDTSQSMIHINQTLLNVIMDASQFMACLNQSLSGVTFKMARLNETLSDVILDTSQSSNMAYLNDFSSDVIVNIIAIAGSIVLLFLIPFILYHSIYSKIYLLNRITTLESILHDLQSSQPILPSGEPDTQINDSKIEDTEVQIWFLKATMRLSGFDRIVLSVCYGLCGLFACNPYSKQRGDRIKRALKERKLEGQYAEIMGKEGDKEDLEKGV